MQSLRKFTIFIACFAAVAAVPAGRRRRRSLYYMKPCGPGERTIPAKTKKQVPSCVQCPPNTYRTDISHAEEACLLCEAGRISSNDNKYCIGDICKAGAYGAKGSNVCTLCNAGEYSIIGQFSCKKCESGRYSHSAGQENCIGEMCPAGKFGLNGQISSSYVTCSTCPSGKWSTSGSSTCLDCGENSYSGENAESCTKHTRCDVSSYYEYMPSKTKNDAKCVRCIYASMIYSIGYFIACMVAAINTCIVLYDCRNNCWVLLFILSPAIWAIVLSRCSSKPDDVPAIISIVMNMLCMQPALRKLLSTCEVQCKKRNPPPSVETEMTKTNECGNDMIAV